MTKKLMTEKLMIEKLMCYDTKTNVMVEKFIL